MSDSVENFALINSFVAELILINMYHGGGTHGIHGDYSRLPPSSELSTIGVCHRERVNVWL